MYSRHTGIELLPKPLQRIMVKSECSNLEILATMRLSISLIMTVTLIILRDVAKYLNRANCVLLPNLTYNPRACFLPKGCIADGSVAILTLAKDDDIVTNEDLAFYATDSFTKFYAIARNLGTRSLNIDNNSVFFFGKLKQQRI